MKKIVIAVLVVALAFTCGTAFAGNNIERGTSEFGISTSLSETETSFSGFGSSSTSFRDSADLNLNYGVFLVGGLQLGASLMLDKGESWDEDASGTKSNESEDETTFVFLDLKYNFVFSKSQPVVPFIGIGVGAASTSSTSGGTTTEGSGTATKLGIGVKFFLTENTSLNAEFRADSFTYTPDGSTYELTQDTTGLHFGLSVYF